MTDPTLKSHARELRNNMTKEERHLWYDFLRPYPAKFLRQHPVERYILDFYCAAARLAIELDGSQHYEPKERAYDARRTQTLQAKGILVLRVPNNAIWENFDGVCTWIDNITRERLKERARPQAPLP